MFKNNKYTNIYFKIIDNINLKGRSKVKGLYESHHIIPKSLGGDNTHFNLILCTPREHYILHLLLVRMVENQNTYKMVSAISRFNNKANCARTYNLLRKTISKYSLGELNPSYGKRWCYSPDKQVYFLLEKEIPKNFILGLPCQQGGVKIGSKWMTKNGKGSIVAKENIQIYLDKGWEFGKHFELDPEIYKRVSKARHTPEKDKKHSKTLTGMIALKHPNKEGYIRVTKDKLKDYLDNGYILLKDSNIKLITSAGRTCSIDNEIYQSVLEASRKLNIDSQKIRRRLINKKYPSWHYV